MNTIAIIPARAGSKGIKNKNIIDFCGKPLLAWSIEQAMGAHGIDTIYVSTDGAEIAKVAEKYGAEIIWRPAEIAGDVSGSEEALLHALSEIKKDRVVDRVVFLQATSPIRTSQNLDEALEIFESNSYDSLFSMAVLEDYCLWREDEGILNSFTYDYLHRGRRQDRKPMYLENGSFYIFKPDILDKCRNRLGGKIGMYNMPFDMSYEIDSMEDIALCEMFFKKYGLQEKK